MLILLFLYLASSLITILFISSDKNTVHNKEDLSLYLKHFKKNIIALLKSKILIELFILISSTQFFSTFLFILASNFY
ncbi:Multidrug resistance protein B (plasmid) [Borrelia miyamotoi FR64b]|uniref:Multidrug resistance protein B n=1 Tax=Borrelia miyamotoi FR64b TaxID=1292392 RepID=W5SFB1_9SPIR|nr:Multidrug resistance protein B [Borrelia miyamotoi FR64b]